MRGQARVRGQAEARVREQAREQARARGAARVERQAVVEARVWGQAVVALRAQPQARAVVELLPGRRFAEVDEVVGLYKSLAARVCIAAERLGRPVQPLHGLAGVVDLAKALASLAGVGVRARFYFGELDPACWAPASSVTLLRKQAVPSAQPDKQLAEVQDQRARSPRECRRWRTQASSEQLLGTSAELARRT